MEKQITRKWRVAFGVSVGSETVTEFQARHCTREKTAPTITLKELKLSINP